MLKDGAAATYGSDAVGGVVNFITKENLRGLDVGADFKQIEDSDGDYYGQRRLRLGQRSLERAVRRRLPAPLRADDPRPRLGGQGRTWTTRRAAGLPPATRTRSFPLGATGRAGRRRRRATRSATPLGGLPGVTATNAPVCYWQYSQYDALTEEEDRWQVYADYNFDITDSTSFHIEGDVRRHRDPDLSDLAVLRRAAGPDAHRQRAATSIAGRPVLRAARTIPGFAPFVAANPGVFPATTGIGALLIANRPFALGGNPLFGYDSSEGPRNYDGFRVSAGLNGDISDSLSWDVAATYMEQNATREGRDTVVNRYQLALRGLGGPNCNIAARHARRERLLLVQPVQQRDSAQSRSPARPTRSSSPARPTTTPN